LPSFWGFCPLFWGFCPLFEDTDRIWLWAFTIRKEIFEYKKPCSSCGMFTYCPHFQESTVGGSTALERCCVRCCPNLGDLSAVATLCKECVHSSLCYNCVTGSFELSCVILAVQ
jgi:hypothetical protein